MSLGRASNQPASLPLRDRVAVGSSSNCRKKPFRRLPFARSATPRLISPALSWSETGVWRLSQPQFRSAHRRLLLPSHVTHPTTADFTVSRLACLGSKQSRRRHWPGRNGSSGRQGVRSLSAFTIGPLVFNYVQSSELPETFSHHPSRVPEHPFPLMHVSPYPQLLETALHQSTAWA